MQPRGRARKGNVSLPKAAADGGASLSGQPMILRGAIWQSCWQEVPCSMDAGGSLRLERFRVAATVAGGTNNHLVSRVLPTLFR